MCMYVCMVCICLCIYCVYVCVHSMYVCGHSVCVCIHAMVCMCGHSCHDVYVCGHSCHGMYVCEHLCHGVCVWAWCLCLGIYAMVCMWRSQENLAELALLLLSCGFWKLNSGCQLCAEITFAN